MPNDSSTLCKQGAGVLIAGALMAGAAVPGQAAVVISGEATKNLSCSNGVCAPTAKAAVLNAGDLETLLASGNVEVTTTGSGVQAKDVRIKAPLSWSTGSTLALDADRSISIDNAISVAGSGGFSLVDDGRVEALSFGKPGSVTFANLSNSLSINGTAYTLVNTLPSLASAIAADPAGAYALAVDYDASNDGTYSTSPVATPFSGTFEGLGNTISKLFISGDVGDNIGLFAELDVGAVVTSVRLVDISVDSDGEAGGLAALNQGELFNVSVGGWIAGTSEVGGIVGDDEGGIVSSSNAHADVIGDGGFAGGLIGYLDGGMVENSSSSGHVLAQEERGQGVPVATGGLVGWSDGSVSNSFATGSVKVKGDANTGTSAGGLLGENSGTISNCYSTGSIKLSVCYEDCYGYNYGGGLVGANGGPISASYSTGAVLVRITDAWLFLGGFLGGNSGTVSHGYWDTTTNSDARTSVGSGSHRGVRGLTTEQFESGLPKGFSTKIWAENPNTNGGLPYLRANPPK